METQEKATQILEQQIKEVLEKITQNKIDIADILLTFLNTQLPNNPEFKDISFLLEGLDKIPRLIKIVQENETKLQTLTDCKSELEKNSSTEQVK